MVSQNGAVRLSFGPQCAMCDVRCFSSAREAAHLDIRPEFGAAAYPPRAPEQLIHGQLQVPGVGMESWKESEAARPACLGPNVQAPLARRWGGTACAVGNGKQHTHEVGERACRSGRWGVDAACLMGVVPSSNISTDPSG